MCYLTRKHAHSGYITIEDSDKLTHQESLSELSVFADSSYVIGFSYSIHSFDFYEQAKQNHMPKDTLSHVMTHIFVQTNYVCIH